MPRRQKGMESTACVWRTSILKRGGNFLHGTRRKEELDAESVSNVPRALAVQTIYMTLTQKTINNPCNSVKAIMPGTPGAGYSPFAPCNPFSALLCPALCRGKLPPGAPLFSDLQLGLTQREALAEDKRAAGRVTLTPSLVEDGRAASLVETVSLHKLSSYEISPPIWFPLLLDPESTVSFFGTFSPSSADDSLPCNS